MVIPVTSLFLRQSRSADSKDRGDGYR